VHPGAVRARRLGLLFVLLLAGGRATLAAGEQTPETVHFPSADGKTSLVGYLFAPSGAAANPGIVLLHGRSGPYSSLAGGVYSAARLSGRHRAWGEFWAERGYAALLVDSFGPRGLKGDCRTGPDEPPITARFDDAMGGLRYLQSQPFVRGDRVAWLAGALLYVRDLASETTTVVPPPPDSAGWYGSGRRVSWAGCCYGLGAFAPGGPWLAVYTHLAGPRALGLAIVDLGTGRAALLPGSENAIPSGGQPSLGWAANGWLFFFASGPTTSIAAWRPGERTAGLVWLDADHDLDAIPRALAPN